MELRQNDRRRIGITDDFMFGYVMRQPGICAAVIECLMPGIHIDRVAFRDEESMFPQTQKAIQGAMGTHSVRLDVYLDDGTTVFNVEMQTGNKMNLPKRVRFYGSRIDCDQLSASADYNQLRPTYVIFICTFDPFHQDRYCYSFENRCKENTDLALGDESYKLFFNTTGHCGEISEDLKKLLDYFDTPDRAPGEQDTELVRKIDQIVDTANQDAEWRREYMTYEQARMDAMQEGYNNGISQGIGQGMNLLSRLVGILLKEKRYNEAQAVAEDPATRDRLLKEYHLT